MAGKKNDEILEYFNRSPRITADELMADAEKNTSIEQLQINNLKFQIAYMREKLTKAQAVNDNYKHLVKKMSSENSQLKREHQRLLHENSMLRREVNNVIVSVPPSEQEQVLMHMVEFSAEQIELTKQQTAMSLAADIKNQILSNMEIMPADKRYDHFLTCCSIFGNVSVINKIIPELKNYLKESNKREKDSGKVQIDINGGNSSIFPNANNVNNYH